MLLKLLMPYRDREFLGATVVKWHKVEGDVVNYGDDLIDIRISTVKGLRRPPYGKEEVDMLTDPEKAQRLMMENELFATGVDSSEAEYGTVKRECFMRVSSSDRGVLRRICAVEGDYRLVGELLAVVTTEEKEPAPESDQSLAEASAFRAHLNYIACELD
jgi:hypothetical protein